MLDCRHANVYFRDPPSVELLTAEGLGRIEVVESAANDLGDFRVHLASGGVEECFHRFRIRGPLQEYFCWPSIVARYLQNSLMTECQ